MPLATHSRATSLSAAALVAAGAIALTACGGSGGSGGDKITDAPSTTSTAATPTTAPPTTAAPANAPQIKLPADVKVEITDPGTGKDAATTKAIADLKYALTALQDGFAQGSGTVPSMLYAYDPQPGVYWSQQIKQFKDAGKTITGTDRFYNIDIRLTDSTSGLVHYCEDQRKSYSKNVKTGKVNVTTPSNKDFYRFTVSLRLDAKSGVWKVNRQNWTQGDKSCISG